MVLELSERWRDSPSDQDAAEIAMKPLEAAPVARDGTAKSMRWRWAAPDEWDAIHAGSPPATGFHSRGWMEAIARWDTRFEACALTFDLADGARVLLPMLRRRGRLRAGLLARAVSSHPNTSGGPIAEGRALSEADWEACLAGARRLPIGRVDCLGNPSQPIPEALIRGREGHDLETHVLRRDAVGADPLASYDATTRRKVRKADELGVRVARESDAAALADYWQMYVESRARWGEAAGTPHTRELLASLVNVAGIELWIARGSDGRALAGGLFVITRAACVYWHGATRVEPGAPPASHALHHAVITASFERGCALYDFNPSGGHAGVIAFKRGFRAEPLTVRGWRLRHRWLARFA